MRVQLLATSDGATRNTRAAQLCRAMLGGLLARRVAGVDVAKLLAALGVGEAAGDGALVVRAVQQHGECVDGRVEMWRVLLVSRLAVHDDEAERLASAMAGVEHWPRAVLSACLRADGTPTTLVFLLRSALAHSTVVALSDEERTALGVRRARC